MKIIGITLNNFKGYEQAHFSFRNGENTGVHPLALFYGPNGIGKSSILEAINLMANPRIFDGRSKDDVDLYMRSLIHDNDYSPQADHVLKKEKNRWDVKAYFDEHWLVATLSADGFHNPLPNAHGGYAFYVDADNSSNLAKFQLIDIQAKSFVELAEAIYGYKVDLDGEVWDERTGEDGVKVRHLFYNDFIILKGSKKVHYAQMSDGEKKIATLLRQLCNPDNVENRDIILIDNIEMHVYHKRHKIMLDKLLELFKGKQIIATTHSPEMINAADPLWRFDLEQYATDIKPSSDFDTDVPDQPATLQEFFAAVGNTLKEWRQGIEDEVVNESVPQYEYPSWVYSTHSVGDFNEIQREAILIDLDEDREFDPIKNQYTPGMLATRTKRTDGLPSNYPIPIGAREKMIDDLLISTPVADILDRKPKVFKPLDELTEYVNRLRKNL